MNSLHWIVIDWYEENKRDLPWRQSNPWGVMVSEFMLQQTPVNRVLPKWIEWMERWPTPSALAEATPADAITAWGRLGYPRRALRLYESAMVIVRDFGGKVPENEEALRTFPGIGEYTAAAKAAFAYKQPTLVLDVNIRRLYSRLLDGVELKTNHINSSERTARMKVAPFGNEHKWSVATMELGAMICTARNPRCDICPLANQCLWRVNGYPKSIVQKKSQLWHGTDRKCRGAIVQALRENESLTASVFFELWNDSSQVERALQSLLVDGLISENESGRYGLPKSLVR